MGLFGKITDIVNGAKWRKTIVGEYVEVDSQVVLQAQWKIGDYSDSSVLNIMLSDGVRIQMEIDTLFQRGEYEKGRIRVVKDINRNFKKAELFVDSYEYYYFSNGLNITFFKNDKQVFQLHEG